MTITKITFQQTFPTGNFMNQKLGVEVEVPDFHPSTGESNIDKARDAFKEAKELVESVFKEMNPNVGEVHTYGTYPAENTTNDPSIDESIAKELEETKRKMYEANNKKEAEAIWLTSGFPFNIELKQILNGKPDA